jgi:hypothetical protein
MEMQEEVEGRVCMGQRIIGAAHGQRTDTENKKKKRKKKIGASYLNFFQIPNILIR